MISSVVIGNVLMFFAGLFAISVGAYNLGKRIYFLFFGEKVAGKVIKLNGFGSYTALVISYPVNGIQKEFTGEFRGNVFTGWLGREVAVRYLPSNPDKALMTVWFAYPIYLLLIIVGLILLMVSFSINPITYFHVI